jgi:exopolysaccharide biosynthesis polyprenyl glycosylphosphotransferase
MQSAGTKLEEAQAPPPAEAPRPVAEPVASSLSERDVRRKRPPVLGFLLRIETLRKLARVTSLLVLDFVGVFMAILTAQSIKAAIVSTLVLDDTWHETVRIVPFAYLVTALLFARSSLYADRAERPGLTRIVASLFQVTVVALIFALVNGEQFSSYYIFYSSLFFAVLYVSLLRSVYERVTGRVLKAAGYRRRTVLVGSGKQIEAVAHALTDQRDGPIEVVGYMSLVPQPYNGLRSLGAVEQLPEVLDRETIDEVIIAAPDFPQDRVVELVDQCHRRGVRIRVAPSTMEVLVHRAEFVPGQTVPLFELTPPVFEGIDFALKRTFDLIGATLLLLVLSPFLLVIAGAVWATSRGGVFYRSIRPGIGGAPFECIKFRTMRSDADQNQADLESLNEASGALFKIRDDPRLTPVGRFLRRFSLDELPQLGNVLRGEMSLVGPRPLPLRDFERLEDWHKKRYLVMPGITGLWQVSGRSELDFDELVRLDFLYLERWSVFLDLTILLKTVRAVLSRRGAF